ncbi:MAG: ABC transporter ATP-binding protein [Gemmatimonadota bacterium]
MIQLRGVEKWYPYQGGRTWVLRNVDLDIEPGDFLTIMGPSGAGKSTLLSILGMMDSEYDGEYRFHGRDLRTLKGKQRAALNKEHVGFVFQRFHLLDDLTVYENIEVPLTYRDVRRSEREARVAEVLDRFNIVAKKDLFPNQLSGGQQQLVAVARAVISRPSLLLADEPTGSLHSSQGDEIMALLAELNREGTTIVQVTHDPRVAEVGKRLIQLQDGWITPRAAGLRAAGV